ncbi:hypothetical protein [Streptomyces sp. NPDC026673]|uniref:hypothetical protein n=1 Tax=Streptomyces sp. NPDC026673 TaxID=3155724 RepID=UPI0033C369AC
MRAIAEHTRSIDDAGYRAAQAALASGDPDDRQLALFLAVVRRDLAWVTAALDDPLLRRRALAAAIRLPVPEEALARLALSGTRGVRHDTFRVLRLSRRHDLAARLIPQVRERHGDAEAARLLPACAPDTVAQWLPRLDTPHGVLASLARTAPRAVAAHLVEAARQPWDHYSWYLVIRRNQQLAETVARRDPGAAVLLAEKATRLMTEEATAAALRRPRDLLAAVRRAALETLPLQATPLSRGVRRALRDLAPEELAALASVCRAPEGESGWQDDLGAVDPLLALVPSGLRAALVRDRMPGPESREVPVRALAALEPGERAALLRPLVTAGTGRRDPSRLRFGTLLPLPEAEGLYRAAADSFATHVRQGAWPALLAAAAYHGDPVEYGRVFASCERAWHDQFTVRQAALAQAATAPARLLAAIPYEALRDAALTTVQSRDSTTYTLESAERLLRRVTLGAAARGDHARAAAVALLLAQVVVDPRRQGEKAPLAVDRPTARAIWSAATPDDAGGSLLGLAVLLERHTSALPGCDAFLARTALEDENPVMAARAAGVWLADPAEREERAARLLASGRPFAEVPRLLWTVVRRRTDLLEALLAAAGSGAWVPRLPETAAGRWLPAQRAAFARRIAAVAGDPDVPMRQRADAAALLRDAPALRRLVAGEAPQPVVAAALSSLGRVADRSALGPLLEHAALGGVRGRAAMSALRRLLDGVPDAEALEWLGGIVRDPRAPVGSRKEAARALGERPGEAAFGLLLAAWDVPGQHRDVLAVLAAPFTRRLEHPGVTARLRGHLGYEAVREVVMGRRRDPLPAARVAYRHFLADVVREGGVEEVVTAACAALRDTGGARGADEVVAAALAAALADATRPQGERSAAGAALVGLARSESAVAELRSALRALVDQAELRLLHGLATDRRGGPSVVHDAFAEALEQAGLPRAATRAAYEAAITAVREGDGGLTRWDRCLRLAGRHPNALGPGGSFYLPDGEREPLTALLDVARALGGRTGTLAGLLAVRLVRHGGSATGWADPWPAELDALRGHADPDVAEEALVVGVRRGDPAGG